MSRVEKNESKIIKYETEVTINGQIFIKIETTYPNENFGYSNETLQAVGFA